MLRATTILILTTIACFPALATASLQVDVALTQHQFFPGEPAFLKLTVKNTSKVQEFIVKMNSRYDLNLKLLDRNGNVVGIRPVEPWYPNGAGFAIEQVIGLGNEFCKSIILHQWYSTLLLPGKYDVEVELESLQFRQAGSGAFGHVEGLPKRYSLPIEVVERNDDRVRAVFERLLDDALSSPSSQEEEKKKRLAADAIIFAQGPVALPFQLRMIEALYTKGSVIETSENRFLEMFRTIAHSGDVETARKLVEFSGAPFFADLRESAAEAGIDKASYSDAVGAWKYLAYAIYELKRTGIPEIVAITTPFTDAIPAPRGIEEFNYLDGGIGRQEDY